MSKRTRYLLLLVGFIVFLIAAPLMVLYVSGVTYDFKEHRFVRTGLLSIRTELKEVSVYLNGKLVRKSMGDISFLRPAEYELKITKEGYFDWHKRLRIEADHVTWANPVPNKLALFYSNPTIHDLANSVSDFSLSGNTLMSISNGQLIITSGKDNNEAKHIPLPKAANTITRSPDGKFLVLTNGTENPSTVLVFDVKTNTFSDISSLTTEPRMWNFSSNNDLYILEGTTISRVIWARNQKTPVINEATTLYIQNNNAYVTKTDGTLSVIDLASLDQQILSSDIPTFTKGRLFVNFQKQIFFLGDTNLYKINAKPELLVDNVSNVEFDPAGPSLIFIHAGQMDFYNFYDNKVSFITRTGNKLQNPELLSPLGFALYLNGNNLNAIELDTRDHQNEYTLYTATNPQKFTIDSTLKTLYVLDDGNLKSIKIR